MELEPLLAANNVSPSLVIEIALILLKPVIVVSIYKVAASTTEIASLAKLVT